MPQLLLEGKLKDPDSKNYIPDLGTVNTEIPETDQAGNYIVVAGLQELLNQKKISISSYLGYEGSGVIIKYGDNTWIINHDSRDTTIEKILQGIHSAETENKTTKSAAKSYKPF